MAIADDRCIERQTNRRKNNMATSKEKSQVIEKFLNCVDCSSVKPSEKDALFFSYYLGSSEGCYMTIGEFEYRCHVADETVYRNAIILYLSIK